MSPAQIQHTSTSTSTSTSTHTHNSIHFTSLSACDCILSVYKLYSFSLSSHSFFTCVLVAVLPVYQFSFSPFLSLAVYLFTLMTLLLLKLPTTIFHSLVKGKVGKIELADVQLISTWTLCSQSKAAVSFGFFLSLFAWTVE